MLWFFFPVLMMMRLWDSHGEKFYHKLSDEFLESWSLTWVKNGDRTWKPLEWLGLVISLTFEPTSWARIEICYWRFSLFEDKRNTCYDDHLYGQSVFVWWLLKSWGDCIVKRAKLNRAIDEELGTSIIPYTTKHFDMLFSPRCFELKDFDMLSAEIWLECESQYPSQRTLLLVEFPRILLKWAS